MSLQTKSHAGRPIGQDPMNSYLPDFQDYLKNSGFVTNSISTHIGRARHFLHWLNLEGLTIQCIDDAVLQRFRCHSCSCPQVRNPSQLSQQSRVVMPSIQHLLSFFEGRKIVSWHDERETNQRLLDSFLEELAGQGYRSSTLKVKRNSCRHFISWLHQSRIATESVDDGILQRFFHHDCLCPNFFLFGESSRQWQVNGLQFVEYLADRGVIADARLRSAAQDTKTELPEFVDWLHRHRGIQESTIEQHVRLVRRVLTRLDIPPQQYDATGIREAMLYQFNTMSPAHAKMLVSSMRMYLRFLASTGVCSAALADAVPAPTHRRLSTLPKYITAEKIEQVIASCDSLTGVVALRDRSILLLLARLALRPGDVATLKLSDIDWLNAKIRVRGKSKTTVMLPLPQDAGDALLNYIENARPRICDERVFWSIRAPYRPCVGNGTIKCIVARALDRAGMPDVRPRGGYLFRHSAATALLRDGATLDEISALLRHRSPASTAIYAKVDRPMLESISQPWMGGAK